MKTPKKSKATKEAKLTLFPLQFDEALKELLNVPRKVVKKKSPK